MSKDKVVVEIKELTYNLLGKLSKIFFKEKQIEINYSLFLNN